MKTITISYDEGLAVSLGESPSTFEHEAPFLLALKLFELGRLSAGKAAELTCILHTVAAGFSLRARKRRATQQTQAKA